MHTVDGDAAWVQGMNLQDSNLEGVDLRGAMLQDVDFTGSNLAGGQFGKARMSAARLDYTDVSRASFVMADLSRATMTFVNGNRVNASYANLRGVDATGASFENSELNGVDLAESILQAVSFDDSSLLGSTFQDAKLVHTTFRNARIRRCKWQGADMRRAIFGTEPPAQSSQSSQEATDTAPEVDKSQEQAASVASRVPSADEWLYTGPWPPTGGTLDDKDAYKPSWYYTGPWPPVGGTNSEFGDRDLESDVCENPIPPANDLEDSLDSTIEDSSSVSLSTASESTGFVFQSPPGFDLAPLGEQAVRETQVRSSPKATAAPPTPTYAEASLRFVASTLTAVGGYVTALPRSTFVIQCREVLTYAAMSFSVVFVVGLPITLLAVAVIAQLYPDAFKPIQNTPTESEVYEQAQAEAEQARQELEMLNEEAEQIERQLLCSWSEAESVQSFLDSTIAQVRVLKAREHARATLLSSLSKTTMMPYERAESSMKLPRVSDREETDEIHPETPVEAIATNPIDFADMSVAANAQKAGAKLNKKNSLSSRTASTTAAQTNTAEGNSEVAKETVVGSDMKENEDVWVKSAKPPLKAKFQPDSTPTRTRTTPLKARTPLSNHRHCKASRAPPLSKTVLYQGVRVTSTTLLTTSWGSKGSSPSGSQCKSTSRSCPLLSIAAIRFRAATGTDTVTAPNMAFCAAYTRIL
eukprot:scaffold533_cov369-Prasinococcus_capsulatus_cf.AAC.31